MEKTLTAEAEADAATEGITTYVLDGEGAPKWRLEHSTTGAAPCARADCKRDGVKIEKGELRIGTQQRIDGEQKYYRQWRHWGCATKHSIKGLKNLCNDDPEKVPGYERISHESREELKRAMGLVEVPDKNFKDIRTDLVKAVDDGYNGEFNDATGYKVEVTKQGRAGCRGISCKEQELKILKGELRLGILRSQDGEADTYYYKHWKCVSKYDLEGVSNSMKQGELEGLKDLPEVYKAAVLASLEYRQAVYPPEVELPVRPKRDCATKKKKKTTTDVTDAEAVSLRKSSRKKRTVEEAYNNKGDVDNAAPKKKRGRKAASMNAVGASVVIPSQQTPTRRSSRLQGFPVGTETNDNRDVPAPKKKRGRKPAASATTITSFDGAMDTRDEPFAKENKQGRETIAVSTEQFTKIAPGVMRGIMSLPEKPVFNKFWRRRRGRKAKALPANANDYAVANPSVSNNPVDIPKNLVRKEHTPGWNANAIPIGNRNPSAMDGGAADMWENSVPQNLGQGRKEKGWSKQSAPKPGFAPSAPAFQYSNRSSGPGNFSRPPQPSSSRDLDAESIAEVRKTIAENNPNKRPRRY